MNPLFDRPTPACFSDFVKARTEELLYLLLWGADRLMRPTFRNLTDSFECWVYRNGFQRRLRELEQRGLLEQPESPGRPSPAVQAVFRLTESGRLVALGGRDPEASWAREWDGNWRPVVFDVPEKHNEARVRLRRFLRVQGFGYLQRSVWISPDPLTAVAKELSRQAGDVEAILTLQARPAAGESDERIVSGAWDFSRINRLYSNCLKVFQRLSELDAREGKLAERLRRWSCAERMAWKRAIAADPLLPRRLLPADYQGVRVWEERMQVLATAAELASHCR